MALSQVINVANYGAVGDYDPVSLSGTDDTAAFTAAFAASNPGDTIQFPAPLPGRGFKISEQINVTRRVVVEGGMADVYLTAGNFLFIDAAAEGSVINAVKVTGQRLPQDHSAIVIASSTVKITNCRFDRLHLAIDVIGGVWQAITNCVVRDCVFGAVQIGNVIGTSIQNLTYDTDVGLYSQPAFGIRTYGEGLRIEGCDIIHAGICMLIETASTRDNYWNVIDACTFDTSSYGILIRNYNVGRKVNGTFFTNCWSASHITAGVLIDANQEVDGVAFQGCHFLNNQQHGVINVGNATNITFTGCEFAGNSVIQPGTYHDIYTDATGSKLIRSNTFGTFGHMGALVSRNVLRGQNDGICLFSENWSNSGATQGTVVGGPVALTYGFNYGDSSPTR